VSWTEHSSSVRELQRKVQRATHNEGPYKGRVARRFAEHGAPRNESKAWESSESHCTAGEPPSRGGFEAYRSKQGWE